MDNNTKTSGSLLTTLLLVLFVALKLTGYIDWSWWWVLSPVWIPLALAIAIVGVVFCILWLQQRNKGAHS